MSHCGRARCCSTRESSFSRTCRMQPLVQILLMVYATPSNKDNRNAPHMLQTKLLSRLLGGGPAFGITVTLVGSHSLSAFFPSPPEVGSRPYQPGQREEKKKGPVEEERSGLLPSLETWLNCDCGRGRSPPTGVAALTRGLFLLFTSNSTPAQ